MFQSWNLFFHFTNAVNCLYYDSFASWNNSLLNMLSRWNPLLYNFKLSISHEVETFVIQHINCIFMTNTFRVMCTIVHTVEIFIGYLFMLSRLNPRFDPFRRTILQFIVKIAIQHLTNNVNATDKSFPNFV